MSIKIKPIINIDSNTGINITYNFPLPELQQAPYDWSFSDGTFIQGTNGGDNFIYIPPNTTITPEFSGFIYREENNYGGTNGTGFINYVSEVLEYETLIFESDKSFKNICDITSWSDSVIGDTDFLKFNKEFRYSNDDSKWSEFIELSDENLTKIYGNPNLKLQFRYVAVPIDTTTYNRNISINVPNDLGWQRVHSGTSFYQFDTDFSVLGTTEYVISVGENGDYYFDIEKNQLYGNKNNGYWGSPINVTINESTDGNTYIPSFITDDIINSAIKGVGIPLDDKVMTPSIDILFGSELSTSEQIPKQNDFIFLNTDFQGFKLSGQESLSIRYTPRNLQEGHRKKLFIESFKILANPYIDERDSSFTLNSENSQVILKPPFLLKAFSIDDYDIDYSTNCNDDCLDIKYRTSSNQRFWTDWFPLTKENIRSIKIDPLSFFYIEFLFTKTCEELCDINIYDVIIHGNYQNISDDYNKLNKFGLRSDCNYGLTTNGTDDNVLGGNENENGNGSDCGVPVEWTSEETCQGSFNPYEYNKSISLYNKISSDISNIFGFDINYYRTDADSNGRDVFLHEYQLHNIVDKQTVKVLFPENKYPDNIVQFNQFDLTLFESFEIHITREEFHRKFGLGMRPAKYDILEICQLNRVYDVEHAQSYKDFMGGSVYYKVILKKHEDNKHINNGEYDSDMKSLVENNSLDKLFKEEVDEDFEKIANNELQENLTEDREPNLTMLEEVESLGEDIENLIIEDEEFVPNIPDKPIHNKFEVYVRSIDYDIQNGSNIISRNYYDLTSQTDNIAISYKTIDDCVPKGKNRAFSLWFNIDNYKIGQVYNFIDNYNKITKNGYRIDFIDGRIEILWGEELYDIDINIKLNLWYGIVINFNQRQEKLDYSIFKLKDQSNPTSTSSSSLELVQEEVFTLVPQQIETDSVLNVKGSPMLWTNMRLFNDIIPSEKKELILNQYIVKDMHKIIVADNATKKVISPHNKF